tara:strand:- start:1479 stop:1814 length:336 start_codon:yes stop_codon:yes gene_type:complete
MKVEDIYDLIAKTSIELGYNTDGKTMAALAKIFYEDLQIDRRIKRMTLEQVQMAFRLGVRNTKGKQQFLNITTFTWWCFQHKQRINEAIYEVETLNKNPNELEYYPKNLLK